MSNVNERTYRDSHDALKQVWGYDDFKNRQLDIIETINSGNDILAVMPTGAGKSVCYQVPALLFEGMTLVVSPLKSLMHDQVARLDTLGVPSTYIDSSIDRQEQLDRLKKAALGRYKILYVAPERLQNNTFISAALNFDLSLIAVDEAHCVSKWGTDFRPEYSMIPQFVKKLDNRPIIAAFTATASKETRLDIIEKLELNSPSIVVTGFDRPNLYLSKESYSDNDSRAFAAAMFALEHNEENGIIYCITKRQIDQIADYIHSFNPSFSFDIYHGDLTDEKREEVLSGFISGDIKLVIATSAFGMGIDKPDIRYVVSVGIRGSIEDYYQNIGRAGRDGKPSNCVLMFNIESDDRTWKLLNRNSLRDLYKRKDMTAADKEKARVLRETDLREMWAYCAERNCLREHIMNYFGQDDAPSQCDNCMNCKP